MHAPTVAVRSDVEREVPEAHTVATGGRASEVAHEERVSRSTARVSIEDDVVGREDVVCVAE